MGRDGNHQRNKDHYKERQHPSQQPGGDTEEQQNHSQQPRKQKRDRQNQTQQTGDQISEQQDQYHQFGGLTWNQQDQPSQFKEYELSLGSNANKDAPIGVMGNRSSIVGNIDQENQGSTEVK